MLFLYMLYSLGTSLLCSLSYLDLVSNQHIYVNSYLGNGSTWLIWALVTWLLIKVRKDFIKKKLRKS